MDTIKEQEVYKTARKQVKKIKEFYHHLMIYIIINLLLMGVNFYQNPNNLWFLWVIFGWGLGLAINAFSVFLPNLFWGKQWEERKIKEWMKRR